MPELELVPDYTMEKNISNGSNSIEEYSKYGYTNFVYDEVFGIIPEEIRDSWKNSVPRTYTAVEYIPPVRYSSNSDTVVS